MEESIVVSVVTFTTSPVFIIRKGEETERVVQATEPMDSDKGLELIVMALDVAGWEKDPEGPVYRDMSCTSIRFYRKKG